MTHPRARHTRAARAAPRGGLRAGPGPPGGGREQLAGRLPPASPPPTRRPLTDFHSPVVEARGGGVQGVEAAVQRGGAAAQRGRLALELAEDVAGTARQVGELRQQADQRVRADLLQRAEERRVGARGRPGPAQPRGLHGPLVEGHGAARAARAGGALKPPPVGAGRESASNTKSSPGSGGAPRGSWCLRPGRTDRRRRAGGEEGSQPQPAARSRGSAPGRPSSAPECPRGARAARREEVQGAAPGRGARRAAASGDARPAEVLQGGRKEPAAPSLPPDWRGRRKRGKCRRHRARGRGGERKERGRRKGPAPGTTCGSRGRRAQRLSAPCRGGLGRTVSGLPRRRPRSPSKPTSWRAEPSPAPRAGAGRSAGAAGSLTCALARWAVSQARPAPREPPAGVRGPRCVPRVYPSATLESGQDFRAASVDLKEDIKPFRCQGVS